MGYMSRIINLLYIADDTFAMPTGVSIYSLKKNKNKNYQYNIHIMCDDVSNENKERLSNICDERFDIYLHDVDSSIYSLMEKKCKLYGGKFHVSRAALLKFDVPDLVPELDRVLYIDGDTIIQDDLVDLFNSDLEGKTVAVVKDMSDMYFTGISEYGKRIGLKISDYFNSGMMLIDLERFRNQGIREKLIKYRMEEYNEYMDQDAFNAVLANDKKVLPSRYNFLAFELLKGPFETVSQNLNDGNTYSDIQDCLRRQSIIHFASFMKPWKYHVPCYSDLFYEYCIESTFCDGTGKMISMMDILIHEYRASNTLSKEIFPNNTVQKGENIVIYGAGKIGKRIHDEICNKRYCNILLWVDKNYAELNGQVSSPELVMGISEELDHVIVAVKAENVAKEICLKLQSMGVDSSKIVMYLEMLS